MEKIINKIAQELNVKSTQVENAVKLIDDGNTIPFIARYRKEATGGLSDEILRDLGERLNYLRNLETRKGEVVNSINEQGKLTDELTIAIASAETLAEVEDLYRPFKQKKKTRATVAKAKGLEPLAEIIIAQEEKTPIEELASEYLNIDSLSEEDKANKDKVVATVEDAIQGALDIIAENISDNAKYRKYIKKVCYHDGSIVTKASNPEEKSNYEMYYDFTELVCKLPSHRILAINRGEKEDCLKVSINKPEEKILYYIQRDIIKGKTQFTEMLEATILDAFKRLIEPSIEREIRSDLTEKAEEKAIKVFGQNAKQLLLGAPIKGKTVMGFDPAYRTGCKIAIIDETGKVLDTSTVYPTAPQNDVEGAKKTLLNLIEKDHVDMIAIGNGTASRESEMFVADLIKEVKHEICYVIVSEAGASVYSASKLATEEYPDINVSIRGAISIARRLQDPLAELVKIDPKAIGVGQYQHDVNQKNLSESLTGVVEDSVNKVGVDVNTATPSLLSYVSGINNTIAKNIVKYRDENGKLKERKELLKVPKLGKVAFEQCAGFIRIPDGINPLENTAVHPESYKPTEKLLELLGFKVKDLKDKDNLNSLREKLKSVNIAETAEKLEIGEMTLTDIIAELSKPGRDPREDMPKPVLRSDVLKFEDLTEGMILTGTVRNVIDFGAFVDIGVKYDGLVHISEMSDSYIKNPSDLVSVGDIVKVKVIKIDQERKKVGLSMKL
jgi:RNA binding S1 domain protein